MTGEKLYTFYSGTQNFPAGMPFYISNGWYEDPASMWFGRYQFQLQVDGVYRVEDFSTLSPIEGSEPPHVMRMFIFNFSDGMDGVHTFTGHWLAPCGAIYESCPDPGEIVEIYTSVVQVTFLP